MADRYGSLPASSVRITLRLSILLCIACLVCLLFTLLAGHPPTFLMPGALLAPSPDSLLS
jgi:hypothetical protein